MVTLEFQIINVHFSNRYRNNHYSFGNNRLKVIRKIETTLDISRRDLFRVKFQLCWES